MLLGSFHTDQQLLTAFADGDRTAATEIYKRHYDMLCGWILKNGGSAADSADVFQEALMVLFGKAKNEQFRLTCTLGTYLFAVSKHLWFKKLELNARQVPLSPVRTDDEEEPKEWAIDEDINVHQEREAHYEQLNEALEKIGEPCKSLIKAFYHEDKSMAQIAADFGYTNPDNAKTQKYKCLNRLRKLFYGVQAK
jgi:RNA polymerase sigma factor (sigma-70 family)